MIDLREFTSKLEHLTRNYASDASSIDDVVKILFVLNKLPKSYSARAKYIKILQAGQSEKDGLCEKDLVVTAKALSALRILDSHLTAVPESIQKYKTAEGLEEFSNSLPWQSKPDTASKKFCALFSLLYETNSLTYEELCGFIAAMHDYTDGDTGLIRSGYIDFHHVKPDKYLIGFLWYLTVLEYTHFPIRYPSRTIDTCIQMYDREYLSKPSIFTAYEWFAWVYCLSRTMRQTGYRYDDCKKRLLEFEKLFCEFLLKANHSYTDIHILLLLLCTVAELQSVLPGTINTGLPLKKFVDEVTFF